MLRQVDQWNGEIVIRHIIGSLFWITSEAADRETQKQIDDRLWEVKWLTKSKHDPHTEWRCACGKYTRLKHRGVTCPRCGVDVILAHVRRERLQRYWFLRRHIFWRLWTGNNALFPARSILREYFNQKTLGYV